MHHRPNALGGFRAIYRDEGWRGLYRGTTLALVGVGNGALQFMAYEQMKSWAFERKRQRSAKLGRAWTMQDDKLVRSAFCTHGVTNTWDSFPLLFLLAMQSNTAYTVMSGASKLAELCATYPYQVIRSRIQVTTTLPSFPLIVLHTDARADAANSLLSE